MANGFEEYFVGRNGSKENVILFSNSLTSDEI
jgi:hypothetical protein